MYPSLGPDGRRCPSEIRMNSNGTFTCEFTTSLVGEHSIDVFIRGENVNVTPGFFTYDASRMRVGPLKPNPGLIGAPVEFEGERESSRSPKKPFVLVRVLTQVVKGPCFGNHG